MREMSAQMETERQRIAMAERKKEELRMMAENAERDRVRAEKKAAKAANKKGNKGTNSSNAANTNNGKHATLEHKFEWWSKCLKQNRESFPKRLKQYIG